MTLEPIPTHPSGVHPQGTKHHSYKRGVLLRLASSHFWELRGLEEKRHGGCGTTILGETIDQRINHEFNFSKALLFHYAHVY